MEVWRPRNVPGSAPVPPVAPANRRISVIRVSDVDTAKLISAAKEEEKKDSGPKPMTLAE